jgi:hypothetical protein
VRYLIDFSGHARPPAVKASAPDPRDDAGVTATAVTSDSLDACRRVKSRPMRMAYLIGWLLVACGVGTLVWARLNHKPARPLRAYDAGGDELNADEEKFLRAAYQACNRETKRFDYANVGRSLGWSDEKTQAMVVSMTMKPGRHFLIPDASGTMTTFYRHGWAVVAPLVEQDEAEHQIAFLKEMKRRTGGSTSRVVNVMDPGFMPGFAGGAVHTCRMLSQRGLVEITTDEMNSGMLATRITRAGLDELATLEEPEGFWHWFFNDPIITGVLSTLIVMLLIIIVARLLGYDLTDVKSFQKP